MDLTFKEDITFNVRTAAFIRHNDEILLSKRSDKDYYSLPGGRVKLGESSKDGLIRELKEELNYDLYPEDLRLVRVIENFFTYQDKENIHEYLFIYEITLPEKNYNGNFTNLENPNMNMLWVREEQFILLPVRPGCIKNIITDNSLKSLIIKENQG